MVTLQNMVVPSVQKVHKAAHPVIHDFSILHMCPVIFHPILAQLEGQLLQLSMPVPISQHRQLIARHALCYVLALAGKLANLAKEWMPEEAKICLLVCCEVQDCLQSGRMIISGHRLMSSAGR